MSDDLHALNMATSRALAYRPLMLRAALLCLIPCVLAAQNPEAGVVAGRIERSDSATGVLPGGGAAVAILGRSGATMTDAAGRFVLASVPAGSHTLRVRLSGYRTVERSVSVTAGDTTRIVVLLERDVQILSPIRTDAPSTDAELFAARPNVGTVALGATTLASAPRLGERDVIRAVQMLPGVEARNDFNTSLNVRGGEADQNLILLDGHPIYNPFHLGGLFSTFMDATVSGIELMTGAFPARFGGRLSSVLDVRSADDARPGVRTTMDVSVLAASARVAGSLRGQGTWSVAARRTYADAATALFTSEVLPYHFRDLHGRATYGFTNGVRVDVTAYAGRDVLDADFGRFRSDSAPSRASEGTWAFDWGNRVIGARIARDFGAGVTVEQRISASDFSTVLDVGDGALVQRNSLRDVRANGLVQRRGDLHDPSIGYELVRHQVRYASGSTATGVSDADLRQRPTFGALWLDDLWRVTPKWMVQGGVRAEALDSRAWRAVSPRLSLKYFVSPSVALTAGAGRVTQYLHSLAGDGPMRLFDVWLASDRYIPVAMAWHAVAGAERRWRDAASMRVEGYVKHYDRVLEVNRSAAPGRRGDELFAAEGVSYGADVLARWQPHSGAQGWIAYTYGVSSRWRDTLRWWPGHDRRHDVNVVATYPLRKYRVGTRFGFASGTPYTPLLGGVARRVYDPSRDLWGTGHPTVFIESIGGRRNSARYPATHRLDVDVSRDFRWSNATIAPYVSVMNAYNARNVFVYLFEYSSDRATRKAISQFPVLPTVGARVAF